MSSFLDQYDSLDVIGNGSFGIIRKVRRKADGLIFARKELNFERMSDRDRKQIVSEVNILKDLHHDHIVRYHDRYVDRDAGILYILMEYCGGGDLSNIIKQAMKQNRPISEDVIWNYFMQILLALHHCHHPNGHGRSSSGSGANCVPPDSESSSRRAQILHRDLKPDNVFLDENNCVKLGDFGLSKALAQASFANTYVGTPYYMSPELMQEKAYDSKSDIWSLGCLIYELCALKPPFHEAKTHSELSILIRNGRIPPLPRGYSQALFGVIKAMLNLNPAMRPSAAQLLQHERLELVFKVAETEKMLSTVKAHKTTIVNKEREVLAREQAIIEKEQHINTLFTQKDQEIAALQHAVAQLQNQQNCQLSQCDVEVAVKQAIARREEELRVLVTKREEEVASAMSKREEEIMEAVRRRETEVCEAWVAREAEIRKEVEQSIKSVEERIEWIAKRENELKIEEARVDGIREDVEDKVRKLEESIAKGKKEKTPLEEVKNLLGPLARIAQETPSQQRKFDNQPTPKPSGIRPLETPITRPAYTNFIPSAMKGVVLTETGETLATPTPAELVNLFNASPKVGLNFAKIFDFEDADDEEEGEKEKREEVTHSPPPSPSSRKERERRSKEKGEGSSSDAGSVNTNSAPPTRLRRPSIRSSTVRPSHTRSATIPPSTTDTASIASSSSTSSSSSSSSVSQPYLQPKPLPHPHLHTSTAITRSSSVPMPRSLPSPEYDLADEENLPSPFLKRTERQNLAVKQDLSAAIRKKRPSTGNVLRAMAAANNVGRKTNGASTTALPWPSTTATTTDTWPSTGEARPSLASARKASEEARKALLRP